MTVCHWFVVFLFWNFYTWSICFVYKLKTIYSSKMVIAILGYSIPCIYLCHHKYNLTDSFYFLKMASVIFSCKSRSWSEILRLQLRSFLKLECFECNNNNRDFVNLQYLRQRFKTYCITEVWFINSYALMGSHINWYKCCPHWDNVQWSWSGSIPQRSRSHIWRSTHARVQSITYLYIEALVGI